MPTHLRGQVLSGARSALSRQPGVTPSIVNPIEGEPNPIVPERDRHLTLCTQYVVDRSPTASV